MDVGAWTNLVGKLLCRKIAQEARGAGFEAKQWKMQQPLSIQGVGDGIQKCAWEARLPIAVPTGTGETELHYFEAPTVEGSGENLPGLLGLRSIRGKNGVLETGAGQERLSFPGPGGYTIEWSPGTQHLPLVCAPSGHLVISVGDFSKIKDKGGLPRKTTTFHATMGRSDIEQSTSSSSHSWDRPAEHS